MINNVSYGESKTWLDSTFRDMATGYEGRAIAVTYYVNNPIPSVCLARLDASGKPEEEWFHGCRLLYVDNKPATGFTPREAS